MILVPVENENSRRREIGRCKFIRFSSSLFHSADIGCNIYSVTYRASFKNLRTVFMIILKREIHLRNI